MNVGYYVIRSQKHQNLIRQWYRIIFKAERTSKVKDFYRWEWSNVSNAKTGWDIITKFSQAPCNSLSFVLCKFQSCSLIDSIFPWFKSICIAFENKHPGGQVSKAVACKAWGHKFESRCKNFRFSPLLKKPDFANFTPSFAHCRLQCAKFSTRHLLQSTKFCTLQ